MDSNDNLQYNEFRKKRIKAFKRIILAALGFFIALPNVLCIFIIITMHKTNSSIDSLSNELNLLKITETQKVAFEETKSVQPDKILLIA